MVFLLVLAAVGLFFHYKQQTADLAKAQSDNDALTQQLADKETAFDALQAKVRQLTAQLASEQAAPASALPSRLSQPAAPASAPNQGQGVWGLQGSGPLDRPAYH
jgi:peptidoglycan hydrolase CwlO-like protein